MKKFIHNVRRQPEAVRRHILHVTTVFFAVILFLLWVLSLGRNFTKDETRAEVRDGVAPLSALKVNLIDGFQSITE
ncbi:MAG: hypothetical protein WCT29_01745 [Candidatus Paceibacterota bacterium]|jgi:hypothetical protein